MMPRTLNGPWSSRPSVALSTFCERELGVLVEFLVVDELADRALALIDLLQNLVEVGHRSGGRVVKRLVGHQFAERALAAADAVDHLPHLASRRPADW